MSGDIKMGEKEEKNTRQRDREREIERREGGR